MKRVKRGANGDIFANGSLSITNPGRVNGDAYSSGACNATNISGTTHAGQTALTFPAINTSYYSANADYSFGPTTWTDQYYDFGATNSIVYFSGDVILNGTTTIGGNATVVVNGNITINGPINYLNGSTKIALLCTKTITFAGGGTYHGFYYARNGTNGAIIVSNASTITGCAAAEVVTVSYTSTVIRNPALDYTLGNALHLPGYGY